MVSWYDSDEAVKRNRGMTSYDKVAVQWIGKRRLGLTNILKVIAQISNSRKRVKMISYKLLFLNRYLVGRVGIEPTTR